MQAMVVTRSIPRQADGAAGRSYQWLRVLKAAGLDVHLLCVPAPGEQGGDIESLRGVCRWAHVFEHNAAPAWRGFKSLLSPMARFESDMNHPTLSAKVAELAAGVKIAVCIDAVFHGMFKPIWGMPPGNRAMYVLDLATPLSERRIVEAKSAGGIRGWLLRADAAELRRLEADAARSADLTMVESDIDLQRLTLRCKTARVWSVADGVEVRDNASERGYTDLPDSVVFLGDPSIDAHLRSAVWLARVVMPLVRKTRDQTVVRFCGAGLESLRREIGELPGVEIHDVTRGGKSLNVALMHSAAAVAPQRDARGTSGAVTLAMAMGRPVVATQTVASCLPGDAGMGTLRADRAPQIAEALVRLLRNRRDAYQQAVRGRELINACATWNTQWARVGAILIEAAGGPVPEITGDVVAAKKPTPPRLAGVAVR